VLVLAMHGDPKKAGLLRSKTSDGMLIVCGGDLAAQDPLRAAFSRCAGKG
jgi:hypothetical protein